MRLLQTPPSGQELIYMAQTQSLLVSIYYDLVAQDIPPVFEDNIAEYFGVDGGDDGWLLKLLKWNPAELQGDVS